MIFAVFDTNVLVSSLLSKIPDSATVQVVDAIAENRVIPLYNDDSLCIVSHCYRGDDEIIRIISARKATKTETNYYSSNRGRDSINE